MSKGLGWGRKVKIPMVLSDFCLAVPRRVDFWTTNSSSSVKGFSGGFRLTVWFRALAGQYTLIPCKQNCKPQWRLLSDSPGA